MHIIKFTQEQIASMRCMDDFYTLTGALEYIKDTANAIVSVEQVFMNSGECEALIPLMLHNTASSKDLKNPARMRFLRNQIGLDWANISPVSCDDTPRGELWFCTKEESDALLEKMRAAAKRKMKKENKKCPIP